MPITTNELSYSELLEKLTERRNNAAAAVEQLDRAIATLKKCPEMLVVLKELLKSAYYPL